MSTDGRREDILNHVAVSNINRNAESFSIQKVDPFDILNTNQVVAFDDNDYIEGSAVGSRLPSLGRLWAFGENRCGQLGLGHSRPFCLLPTLITFVLPFEASSARILNIAVGGAQSLALVCHKNCIDLMMSGRTQDGDSSNPQLMFKQISIAINELSPGSLTGIAASEYISAASFQDGSIVVWGKWSGQIPGLGRIVKLQCSDEHVVLCDSEGLISVINCHLQIFHSKLSKSTKIIDISCFSTSCLILSDSGLVYAWKFDQLSEDSIDMQHVPLEATIVQIACGKQHYMALSSKGEVFSWGCGQHGSLGMGSNSDVISPARIPSITDHVVQIAAGAYHSVCLTAEGTVYTWGDGAYGQLGNNDIFASALPWPVLSLEGKGIRQIAAGPNQTLAYVDCFVGPGEILQRLQQSSRGICFTKDPLEGTAAVHPFSVPEFDYQDILERDAYNEAMVDHLVYVFNNRPYTVNIVLCRKTSMMHLLVHFEVEQDTCFRGALNNYIRNCFERDDGKYCYVFKNFSVSQPQNVHASSLQCTLLVICKKSLLSKDSLQQVPDWLSLFIEAFHPLDVKPKFVALCPSIFFEKLSIDS